MHPVLIAARLVVRDMGGAATAGCHLGKAASTLNHEIDPHYEGTAKLGVLDVVTLTQASRDTRIVDAIAAECGGVFLPLPGVADGAEGTMDHVASLVREFGEVLTDVSTATSDGRVTDNELARLQGQALDVSGELQQLLTHLRRLNGESKPAAVRAERKGRVAA